MSVDPIYTLSDLASWKRSGPSFAVVGHPIKHSISPPMHNAALAHLAEHDVRFADWRYFRFDIPPDDLPRALELFHQRGFFGLNLTVPHKIIAFSRVSQVDRAAQPIGAVNTLRRAENGWHGFNTDGYGLLTGIEEDFKIKLAGTHVLLLGAGGAARSAAVECLQSHCASLTIVNRTSSRAAELIEALRAVPQTAPVRVLAVSEIGALAPGALVVNATSSGLHATDAPPIDLAAIGRPAAVYDMIYNPPRTPLLMQAASLGVPYANGLSMLIHQGARSFELWTDQGPPVEVMRAAVNAELRPSA